MLKKALVRLMLPALKRHAQRFPNDLVFRHLRLGNTGPRQAGRLAAQTGNAETSGPHPVSGFPLLSNPGTPEDDWRAVGGGVQPQQLRAKVR